MSTQPITENDSTIIAREGETLRAPAKKGFWNWVREHPRTSTLATLLLTGIIGYSSLRSVKYNMSERPENKHPSYAFMTSQGITHENAILLAPELIGELSANQKQAIEVISKYPPALQRECVSSDVWANRHISDAEVLAIKNAGLEGRVINPSEVYAVLANAPGDTMPEHYNQRGTEFALTGMLSFYKWMKSNGIDDEHIKLLVYNPSEADFYDNQATRFVKQGGLWLPAGVSPEKIIPIRGDEIKVDEDSTAESFYRAITENRSDENDILYLLIATPSPNLTGVLKERARNKSFIDFDRGLVSSTGIISRLNSSNPYNNFSRYRQAVLIGQNYGAQRLVSGFPKDATIETGENIAPAREIISIAASNYDTDTMLFRLVADSYANPRGSIEGIVGNLNSGAERVIVAYHNKDGDDRNPAESPEYKKPFPTGYHNL